MSKFYNARWVPFEWFERPSGFKIHQVTEASVTDTYEQGGFYGVLKSDDTVREVVRISAIRRKTCMFEVRKCKRSFTILREPCIVDGQTTTCPNLYIRYNFLEDIDFKFACYRAALDEPPHKPAFVESVTTNLFTLVRLAPTIHVFKGVADESIIEQFEKNTDNVL